VEGFKDYPYKPGEFEALEAEAKPIATHMAQEIADLANKKKEKAGGASAFAILLAELALQALVITIVLAVEKSHSKEGEQLIENTYEKFKQAAKQRWYKKDILGMGKGEPYGQA